MKFKEKIISDKRGYENVDWNVKNMISNGNLKACAFSMCLVFFPFGYNDSILIIFIYKILKIINILIPIIAIYLAIKYKWVSVCNVKNAKDIKNPLSVTVGLMIFLPSFSLIFGGAVEYDLEPTKAFWAYGIVLAIILLVIIIRKTTWDKSLQTAFVLFFILMIYSLGVIQEINCGFFNTKKTVYDAEVLEMSHKGRSDYHICIEPKYKDYVWISVSPGIYSRIHKHDEVKMVSCRGVLGIDWHTVRF